MEKVVVVARVLLGLIFTVFGLNALIQFLPMPELSEDAGAFFRALAASGFVVPLLTITELGAGILLLAGFLVPLALTILAPIVTMIVLFHVFLDPSGMAMAIMVLVLETFLAWSYRDSFRGVLDPRAKPTV